MWQGGWQVKGPWVSGFELGVWGGNANAFSRPTFYTRYSPPFLACGDYVPVEVLFCRSRAVP